jgi:outer membrane biosynthesis protein TonB
LRIIANQFFSLFNPNQPQHAENATKNTTSHKTTTTTTTTKRKKRRKKEKVIGKKTTTTEKKATEKRKSHRKKNNNKQKKKQQQAEKKQQQQKGVHSKKPISTKKNPVVRSFFSVNVADTREKKKSFVLATFRRLQFFNPFLFLAGAKSRN